MGTNAIVGGGVPQAAGFAWAHRRAGTDAVSVTYFGDGAVNIGSTLEAFNLASAWRLPVCFFVENNLYAVSTNVFEATGEPRLAARGPGFGIPSWRVDGMDPLAVHLAVREAVAHLRAGNGPTLVEATTYRYFHQNGGFPGSAFGYRTKDEERQWRDRDPITQLPGHLVRRSLLTQEEIDAAKARARRTMASLGELLLEPLPGGRAGQRRIGPAEWPDPAFADVGVRGDLSEFADARFECTGALAEQRFIDAVAGVMNRRMETDDRTVVLGEDVHRLNGAPTVLFNQIGKARHMFGGAGGVPLVLRAKVAMGTGYGSQHSMDPAGIFATAPGWRIVAPTTPFDYVGPMNSALRCADPVLVLEHVDLYKSTGDGPVTDLDYCLPVGSAAVRREGSAVTVLSYLAMVGSVLSAIESAGVDAEVIDLRWLDRASIDWPTIERSVMKTNNVVIAEQGPRGTSYGGWLADEIQRRYFDRLDQPVRRVTGGEASPSISRILERAAIAGTEEVAATLTEITRYR